MTGMQIEAMLASPPERDELVVQLFTKDGGQWAEIYREHDVYWIDLYKPGPTPLKFKLDELIDSLNRSSSELRDRLGDGVSGE